MSVNKAGMVWPWVGDVCRIAMETFGIFANINLYATREGAKVAVPPHNDRYGSSAFATVALHTVMECFGVIADLMSNATW